MFLPVILLVLLSYILFAIHSVFLLIFLAYKMQRTAEFIVWCSACFLLHSAVYYVLFFNEIRLDFHLCVFLIIFLCCIFIPVCFRGIFAHIKKKRQ